MAFVNYNFSLFNRQSLFFVTLCYDFSAFCAFFDSLRSTHEALTYVRLPLYKPNFVKLHSGRCLI